MSHFFGYTTEQCVIKSYNEFPCDKEKTFYYSIDNYNFSITSNIFDCSKKAIDKIKRWPWCSNSKPMFIILSLSTNNQLIVNCFCKRNYKIAYDFMGTIDKNIVYDHSKLFFYKKVKIVYDYCVFCVWVK